MCSRNRLAILTITNDNKITCPCKLLRPEHIDEDVRRLTIDNQIFRKYFFFRTDEIQFVNKNEPTITIQFGAIYM